MRTAETERTLYFFTFSRIHRDSEGRYRTPNPVMSVASWEGYLRVFTRIVIYARVDPSLVRDDGYVLDHPAIEVVGIPFFSGARGYVLNSRRIRRFIDTHVVDPTGYYGLWLPNRASAHFAKSVNRLDAPLLSVVIGDAEDVALSILPGPLKRIGAHLTRRTMSRTVAYSSAVVYVTLEALQRKYPAPATALTLARTNLQLPEDLSITPRCDYSDFTGDAQISLITVGSQEQNYKGHDLLIESVAQLNKEGHDIRLTIIGQGALHDSLVHQAQRSVPGRVEFLKNVGTAEDVAARIAAHDIFVIPSRSEGMPKVLLEAMAVGTFALGARVGGIPDILDSACTFESNSVEALTSRIRHFVADPHGIQMHVQSQTEMISKIRKNHSGPDVLARLLNTWVEAHDTALDKKRI